MHIKFAPLPVSDQSRAKDFYIGYFGCEVASDRLTKTMGGVGSDCGFRRPKPPCCSSAGKMTVRAQHRVVLVDPNPDAIVDSLKAQGVEIITEPKEAPWQPGRRFAEFRDSEGNRMVIATS